MSGEETAPEKVGEWTNAHRNPGGALYTLDDVQEYEAEVQRAIREDRDPTLSDPRNRRHDAEISEEVEAENSELTEETEPQLQFDGGTPEGD